MEGSLLATLTAQPFLVIVASTILVFWAVALPLTYVDVTGRPEWMRRFKTQPGKNEPLDRRQLSNVLWNIIPNQLFCGIPSLLALYRLLEWRGSDLTLIFPSPQVFLRDFVLCAVFEEIGFYYSHRALHHPLLYKSIHKKHHEWTAPISLVAIYAHPIEFLFSNIAPLALGPVLLRSCLVTTVAWFSVALCTTILHHSGYHLPLAGSPEFHDYHHLRFRGNYGVLGVLDWLHGTDVEFRKSKQFRRHRMILSASQMNTS